MVEDDDNPTEVPTQAAAPPVHEPARHELRAGMQIGEYVLDGELGHGGMGVVYAATHPLIGKRAAIKVLRSSENPAAIERFIQEARAVNQIGHSNIVDIFDFSQLPDGRSYLVMDLLDGESLRARVRRGPLPVASALAVLEQIASALEAAHGKGFAHRDLKPDNVFLSDRGERLDVKLLDFGLAKLLPTSAIADERLFRTAVGVQVGTPEYMSPEQLRAAPDVDHRTDIYALGVLAYEILVGRRPRSRDGRFEPEPGAHLREAVPDAPGELVRLVEQMLAYEPDERPELAAVRPTLRRMRRASAENAPIANGAVAAPVVAAPAVAAPVVAAPGVAAAPVVAAPAVVAAPVVRELTPSLVGARPMLPTPPKGQPKLGVAAPKASTQLGFEPARAPARASLAPAPAPAVPAVPSAPISPSAIAPAAAPASHRGWWLVALALAIAAAVAIVIARG